RFSIPAAFRTVRGRQPGDFEPRMMLEHLHKALPHDSGSAQDSDRDFRLHDVVWNFTTPASQTRQAPRMRPLLNRDTPDILFRLSVWNGRREPQCPNCARTSSPKEWVVIATERAKRPNS